jgi:hypothetical protein
VFRARTLGLHSGLGTGLSSISHQHLSWLHGTGNLAPPSTHSPFLQRGAGKAHCRPGNQQKTWEAGQDDRRGLNSQRRATPRSRHKLGLLTGTAPSSLCPLPYWLATLVLLHTCSHSSSSLFGAHRSTPMYTVDLKKLRLRAVSALLEVTAIL